VAGCDEMSLSCEQRMRKELKDGRYNFAVNLPLFHDDTVFIIPPCHYQHFALQSIHLFCPEICASFSGMAQET
jgi:hypothetical protein